MGDTVNTLRNIFNNHISNHMTILWELITKMNPMVNPFLQRDSVPPDFSVCKVLGVLRDFSQNNPPLFMSLTAFVDIRVCEDALNRKQFPSFGKMNHFQSRYFLDFND